MRRIYLSFSRLSYFAYNIDKRLLEICLPGGIVQHYLDVPSTIYFSLLHAYSPDEYFDKYIRPAFNFVNVNKQ